MHCLIADDSSVVRKVARRIMEELDWTVSEAEDGREALAMCRRAMPDAIFVDRSMPNMDSFEFLRALRRDVEGGKHPKVMFCTSELDVPLIARAKHAGADDYVLKPFDRAVLEQKLQENGLL
jgi:two-component system chemotaxis response regulator CheY